jgi:hypothetical protein
MAITFSVSDVELGDERIECIDVPSAIHRLTTDARSVMVEKADGTTSWQVQRPPPLPCEAWSDIEGGVCEVGVHPLVGAIQLAFNHHLPLELSPDHIWIVLAQGFARHVHAHAEELRHQFVSRVGRERLEVRRDDFQKGARTNDWPAVFASFSTQLREHIGKRHDLIVADFSTTGPLERAVSEVVLMDAMEKYFEFAVRSVCGIPKITLLGTAQDWRSIRTRAQVFREFGLDWWLDELTPALDAFVDAAEGRADVPFWRSLYKLKGASGGPYVTGWVQLLFPYTLNTMTRQAVQNPHMVAWRAGMDTPFGGGPTTDELPGSLSSVPFDWHYFDQHFDMAFLAGFIGVVQDSHSLTVSPQLGWAIGERR